MNSATPPLTVALLAVADVTASTVLGMHDLFSAVGRDWGLIVAGVPGEPRLRPLIVGRTAERFRAANDVWLQPHHGLADCPVPDVVCVSDMFVAPGDDLAGRYDPEVRWLRDCHARGATVATACAGVLLPAYAGLLEGQDATVHWGYCDALAAAFPGVRVHRNRALVVSGEGNRLIMAGGGTTWQDLALYLIARFVDVEEAMRVARCYLLDWHADGQQPYAVLSRTRQADDALVARCQAWVAGHYDEPAPVAAMVALSGLPERSFKRRFRRATGMSPLEYVHTLRLEEAKQMLEAGPLAIDAIANEVGYEDASFFGRLFKRNVGLTPAQYRRRFGSLRAALRAARAPTGVRPQ